MLVFPEGTKATGKLVRDRYQLRRFGRGGLRRDRHARRRADRADGDRRQRGGDADPLQERPARQADRASPTSPSPPTSSCSDRCWGTWCRCPRSSASGCCRRSLRRRRPARRRYNRGVVMEESDRIRDSIQSAVARHAAQTAAACGAADGAAGVRILVTGLGTFWGSRIAQRPRADPTSSSWWASTIASRAAARADRVREGRRVPTAILQRMVRATQVDTVLHTHLEVDSTRTSSRRLHEVNVIGTMNLLAAAGGRRQLGAQARAQDVDAGVRLELRRPLLLPRGRPARTCPPIDSGRAVAARGRRAGARLRRRQPDVPVTTLRFANVLGDDLSTVFSRMLRMPAVPEVFGYDPRLQFVHEDDVTRGARVRDASPTRPGRVQRGGSGHDHVERGVPAGRTPPAGHAAGADRRGRGAAAPAARSSTSRPRCSACCATGGRSTPTRSSPPASTTATTTLATVEAFAPARRDWNGSSGARRRTATSTTSRSSSGTPAPSADRDP